jgi:hypothetical protein
MLCQYHQHNLFYLLYIYIYIYNVSQINVSPACTSRHASAPCLRMVPPLDVMSAFSILTPCPQPAWSADASAPCHAVFSMFLPLSCFLYAPSSMPLPICRLLYSASSILLPKVELRSSPASVSRPCCLSVTSPLHPCHVPTKAMSRSH